jgi:hypothetical protein
LPIVVPLESIRKIIQVKGFAEEELMQSVEDTIVEKAEVTGHNPTYTNGTEDEYR